MTSYTHDGSAPSVSSVSSSTANGSYKAGQVIAVTVTFSESVTVTGTPQITLETGATDAVVNYASGSGTATLTFNYTISAGHSSADLDYINTSALALNTGTIKDSAGNNASLTLPAVGGASSIAGQKAIVIDTAGPVFSSLSIVTASPSSTNFTPTVSFTVDEGATVTLYSDSACSTSISSGSSVAAGARTMTTSTLPDSGNNTIYIRGLDSIGNSSALCSLVGTYVTQLPAVSLALPSIYVTSLGLSWSTLSGATYNLYYSTSDNLSTWYTLTNVTPVYTHSPLTGGVTYYYRVAAVKNGVVGVLSNEVSGVPYIGQLAAPTLSPGAGTYVGTQSVSLTGSGTIRYTTNGVDPDCSSTTYTGAISVSSNMTLKAIACGANYQPSSVASAAYTILSMQTFSYTGSTQTYTVPAGVKSVNVKLWGAGGGGTATSGCSTYGGAGGYAGGTISVTAGDVLTIIVGGGGGAHSGGGRSAVRNSGGTELVTAGGGGGAGECNSGLHGAPGGGTSGGNASVGGGTGGGGGTQSTGGTGGYHNFGSACGYAGPPPFSTTGSQFQGGVGYGGLLLGSGGFGGGGSGYDEYCDGGGGGGGGGYYGGGGGGGGSSNNFPGGGGGSSYLGGVSNGSTTGGSGTTPGNNLDANYLSGIGVGGSPAGSGGNGRIVIIPSSGPLVFVVTSGTSVTVPSGKTSVKIWAIGGGGGGAGATNNDSTAGGGGGAGGVVYKTFTVTSGQSISYSLGLAGTGGYNASNGGSGGTTSVTVSATTIYGYGGSGGFYNSATAASGGIHSGGDGGAIGGSGPGASGDVGGGSGGAVGGVNGTTNYSSSAPGSNSADVSGLFTALSYVSGYPTTSGGAASPTNGYSTANINHGGAASGFGCSGASGAYYGGNGGAGLYGGGGGGAAGYTGIQSGGNGGQGVVVMQFN